MPHRSTLAALAILALAGGAVAQDAPAQPAAQPAGAPAPQVRAARPAPKLVVEPASLDFGSMTDDVSAFKEFTVRNDGDADLVIAGMSSTCGCTIPTIGGRKLDTKNKQSESTSVTLKPGETVQVQIEFHPAGKRDAQNQKVTIRSNDPARRELVFDVLAHVTPIVRCEPEIINFGDVERGQTKTVIATITGRTPDFAIPLVTTGSDIIKAKVLDTVASEVDGVTLRHVRVELTLSAAKPTQQLSGVIGFRTSDTRRRLISVPIAGSVLGDLSFSSGKILPLGMVAPGAEVAKPVRIRSRSGSSFNILDVKERGMDISPARWEVVEAPDEPGAFDLILTFTAPQKPGSWKGTLIVFTDVPDQEKVEVPYSGTVRQAVSGATPPQPSFNRPGPAEPAAQPAGQPGPDKR
jgi:hypothetical protein